jgi:hypothetical protein
MATTIDDIIQAGLEEADCEKSNNFSASEKLRKANEAVRYVYDFLVEKWGDTYFQKLSTFTLPSTNTITLDEACGANPPETYGDFYKEQGLTKTDGGAPETILPLAGYPSRNDCAARRYWIAGGDLTLWPQVNGQSHAGTYVLTYTPNCPVTVLGDKLPVELERWAELINVTLAIKFMTKRRQDTTDLERRQGKLEAAIVIAAGQRKAEVRKLRVNRDHDQFPGFGWGRNYPRN